MFLFDLLASFREHSAQPTVFDAVVPDKALEHRREHSDRQKTIAPSQRVSPSRASQQPRRDGRYEHPQGTRRVDRNRQGGWKSKRGGLELRGAGSNQINDSIMSPLTGRFGNAGNPSHPPVLIETTPRGRGVMIPLRGVDMSSSRVRPGIKTRRPNMF